MEQKIAEDAGNLVRIKAPPPILKNLQYYKGIDLNRHDGLARKYPSQ